MKLCKDKRQKICQDDGFVSGSTFGIHACNISTWSIFTGRNEEERSGITWINAEFRRWNV